LGISLYMYRRGNASLSGRLIGSKRGSMPPGVDDTNMSLSTTADDSLDGEEEKWV
jgi:hypothetical protein